MATRSKAGGGIHSREVKRVGQRTGHRAREMRHEGVAQMGTSRGNHVMESSRMLRKDREPVRGERRPAGTPGSVPLGNALSTNVGKGGPGTGRTVYHTGYQDVHGAPNPGNPRPKGPDIWTEFPPNIGGRLGGRR